MFVYSSARAGRSKGPMLSALPLPRLSCLTLIAHERPSGETETNRIKRRRLPQPTPVACSLVSNQLCFYSMHRPRTHVSCDGTKTSAKRDDDTKTQEAEISSAFSSASIGLLKESQCGLMPFIHAKSLRVSRANGMREGTVTLGLFPLTNANFHPIREPDGRENQIDPALGGE